VFVLNGVVGLFVVCLVPLTYGVFGLVGTRAAHRAALIVVPLGRVREGSLVLAFWLNKL
jgi:hypothetical protein